MDAITGARSQRILEFGMACNKVLAYKYGVPKAVISELVDFRLSLTAAKQDPVIGDIAKNRLVVLDNLLAYAKAFNAGDEKTAEKFKQKSVEAHKKGDRMIEEVVNRGI